MLLKVPEDRTFYSNSSGVYDITVNAFQFREILVFLLSTTAALMEKMMAKKSPFALSQSFHMALKGHVQKN